MLHENLQKSRRFFILVDDEGIFYDSRTLHILQIVGEQFVCFFIQNLVKVLLQY